MDCVGGGEDPAQVAAQIGRSLHQVDGEALIRQGQGGAHAGHAAADHQGGRLDGDVDGVLGFQQGGAGDGHTYQVPGFSRSHIPVVGMYPGALVADIGHLEHVGVKPGGPQAVLEKGCVGEGRTTGHHHPVEVVLDDPFGDGLDRILGAGVQVILSVDYIRQAGGVMGDGRHIQEPADIRAAVADKYPDAGGFCPNISSRGVFLEMGGMTSGNRPASRHWQQRPRWPRPPIRGCPWVLGKGRWRRSPAGWFGPDWPGRCGRNRYSSSWTSREAASSRSRSEISMPTESTTRSKSSVLGYLPGPISG